VSEPHYFLRLCLSRLPKLFVVGLLLLSLGAYVKHNGFIRPQRESWSLEDLSDYNVTHLAILGFFRQDGPDANATKIGPAPDRFGLIDDKGKYWKKFQEDIKKLNKKAEKYTEYKVLYLGRHGEGWHNVGQDIYGEDAWDEKWGRMNGNGNITWGPDARLTPKGVHQAMEVNHVWRRELYHGGGIPLPTKTFVSPLRRALHTFNISYSNLDIPPPTIIEDLRDTNGLRTSDIRHNKTWLHAHYPTYKFEEGFTEQDELWTKDTREQDEHVYERVRVVLNRILKNKDIYMGVVCHNDIINDSLDLTKHDKYEMATGGVVPVVVKVTYTKKVK